MEIATSMLLVVVLPLGRCAACGFNSIAKTA